MQAVQKHPVMTEAIEVEISDEGFKALRKRVNELQPAMDYTDPREMPRVETNEVEFDYYMTMRQMSAQEGYNNTEGTFLICDCKGSESFFILQEKEK